MYHLKGVPEGNRKNGKKMKKSKNPIGNFKEVKKNTSTHTERG